MNNREQVIKSIQKHKLIVIIRDIPEDKLIDLAQALYDAGIRLAEITFSKNHNMTDEKTAKCIKLLSQHFEGKMLIGSGTVLTKEQVKLTKEAGGLFVISPNTDIEVIKETRNLELVSIPGSFTPTEMHTAVTQGADFVKIFPAANLGVSYIKAIKAPFPAINLLAVGGINLENMHDYHNAGVCGFGIGTSIVNKNLIMKNDFKQITEIAKKYIMELEDK